jgi:hypothetical protein
MTKKANMKTWQGLGYLGLIPFVAFLWLFEVSPSFNLLNPQQAFIYYSVIILSFLAGATWKKDTLETHHVSQIISNVFCLYAFMCLFIPFFYALIFLPIGYLGLLSAEFFLWIDADKSFTKAYSKMRIILTMTVIGLHVVALVLWF